MAKLNERVAVLEARYERVPLLEKEMAELKVWLKCGVYLLSALLTHLVASPWVLALQGSLGGSL